MTNVEYLVQQVLENLEPTDEMQLLVIEGMCGSGKTTLARALSEKLDAPVIHMDDFFLPYHLRTRERLSQPGGNVDYERFEQEVLPFVGKQTVFSYRRFSCDDGTFSPKTCPAGKIRIVEGSYSLHPRFQPFWTQMNAFCVFLSVDEREQMRRIAARNPELTEKFRTLWIPMENAYFSAFSIPQKAHLHLKSPAGER